MRMYNAVAIAEGWEEAEDFDGYVEAWQYLIDTGAAWQLPGFFGRTAEAMIEAGHCTPPDGRMQDHVH